MVKLKKNEVIACLENQKQLHAATYSKNKTNVYDNWDNYKNLNEKNKAIQLYKIKCEEVETTSTGIYLKQSYQHIDSLIYGSIDINTNELTSINISFETNYYNEYWQKQAILKIVIDFLNYKYGYFEVEYIEKDCCFKWNTPDEIVTLTMRHPDNTATFYYSFIITIVENWD